MNQVEIMTDADEATECFRRCRQLLAGIETTTNQTIVRAQRTRQSCQMRRVPPSATGVLRALNLETPATTIEEALRKANQ